MISHRETTQFSSSLVLQNDMNFFRVRTRKHEVLVAPDREYILIVVQNPNAAAAGTDGVPGGL
jgi:dynein light chain roadblock-type